MVVWISDDTRKRILENLKIFPSFGVVLVFFSKFCSYSCFFPSFGVVLVCNIFYGYCSVFRSSFVR